MPTQSGLVVEAEEDSSAEEEDVADDDDQGGFKTPLPKGLDHETCKRM